MMTSRLKNKFWIDACASSRHLTNQTTSVPTLVHVSTPQNEAVFDCDLKDFSDISSDLPDIMMMTSDDGIPDLNDVSDAAWFA